ncbi:MAG: WD40 repeat domain-containing protein [Ilumatobacteraceae bacterium]
MWDPDHPDHTPLVLTGHTDRVVAVGVMTGADGRPRIISGSWDGTVRCGTRTIPDHTLVLSGHTDRVWAVGVMTGADGRPRIIPAATMARCGCGTRTIPITPLWSCPVTPAGWWRWG